MVLSAAAVLMVAAVAVARPTYPWHPKDIETAIRALSYPKAHPRTLSCKGQGHNTYGRYDSWLCHATYAHKERRTFVMGGEGAGGWLCGGKTLKTCKLLGHGFVTNAQVLDFRGLEKIAEIASPSYVAIHGGPDDGPNFCTQSGTTAWSCHFNTPTGTITVTISFKKAKGGWITTGSTSSS